MKFVSLHQWPVNMTKNPSRQAETWIKAAHHSLVTKKNHFYIILFWGSQYDYKYGNS